MSHIADWQRVSRAERVDIDRIEANKREARENAATCLPHSRRGVERLDMCGDEDNKREARVTSVTRWVFVVSEKVNCERRHWTLVL